MPECPVGLVEHGEDCVPSIESTAPPSPWPPSMLEPSTSEPSTSARAPHLGSSWPSQATHPDRARASVRVSRGEDEALIALSLGVFDAGWALGWIGTAIGVLGNPSSAPTATISLVPVVGSITYGFVSQSWVAALAFGIPSLILQVVGVLMIGISLSNETTELEVTDLRATRRARPDPAPLSLRVLPAAEGADAGLSIRLEL
ncbi:MAG: hypothetical protein K1X94_05555 [Sandaracinaceae bacterium]|nr:hypothetical protein [Sandaracinaceae bacterium]